MLLLLIVNLSVLIMTNRRLGGFPYLREIMNDMFRLWWLAEQDLLSETEAYILKVTTKKSVSAVVKHDDPVLLLFSSYVFFFSTVCKIVNLAILFLNSLGYRPRHAETTAVSTNI